MSKEKLTTKLAAAEASLKRWQTRLKRAATMVNQLDKARRRYQLALLSEGQPVIATVRVKVPVETDHLPEAEFEKLVTKMESDNVTRPPFLDRSIPAVAEAMTAARKKSEAAARSAMPLTGREALKAIKRKK
jgi:hypothetical protein